MTRNPKTANANGEGPDPPRPAEVELHTRRGDDDPTASDFPRVSRVRRHARALGIVSRALAEGANQEFFDAAVLALVEALPLDFAFVGEVVEPERDRVELRAFAGADGLEDAPTYALEHTPCRVVIEEKRPVFTDEAVRDFPLDAMLVDLDVRSYHALPLLDVEGECIGILGLLARASVELEDTLPEMLELVAGRASGEIQRQRTERRRARTELLLRAVMEASSRFVWSVDARGNPTLDSVEMWQETTGRDDHTGPQRWIEAVLPEDRASVWSEWRSAFEEQRAVELAYRIDGGDGIRRLEVRGLPIHGDHGEFEGYVGVVDDVTELHRATEELRQRNDVLRLLRAVPEATHQGAGFLESVKVGMEEICRSVPFDVGRLWMPDRPRGSFRYTGLQCPPPADTRGAGPPDSMASPLEADEDLAHRISPDHGPLWIEGTGRGHTIAHDGIAGGRPGDPTDGREESPTAVYVCVPHGDEPVAILEFMARERLLSDETWLEVLSQIGIQLGRSYERDRTQHQMRQAEQQARESQKLEAVGRLAGGIAHDFNNILMVVLGEAELALRGKGLDDDVRTALDEIRESGRRAASLTAQLLAFSRREIESPESVDLAEALRNGERMLRRLIGEDIQLVTEGLDDAGPCCVRVCGGLVDQVVMNLAINAREAMPEGGTVTIRLGTEHVPPERCTAIVGVEPGRYAVITVADTGVGIPEGIRNNLFEPFFTTKENGSGFGLSTSYGIVKSAGGFIEFDSEMGVGSEFRVYLPLLDDEEAPAGVDDGEAPRDPDELLHVLIVEDDDGVRSVAIRILSHAGYEVSAARGLDDLEEFLRTTSRAPDIVLTDCVLEKGTGREIDTRVRDVFPDVGTVFMSGYTDDVLLRQGVRPEGSAFLPKPFSPEALVEAVASVRAETLQGTKRKHAHHVHPATDSVDDHGDREHVRRARERAPTFPARAEQRPDAHPGQRAVGTVDARSRGTGSP